MSPSLSLLLVFAVCGQVPQPAASRPTTAERLVEHVKEMVTASKGAAEQSLQRLSELVNKENFESLGFASLEEIKEATLGEPLPVILMRLDELKTHQAGDDPYPLLHPIPKVMYCVNVKGQTRCAVEVDRQDGKWVGSSFGIAGPAREYVDAIKQHAKADRATRFFLIKVAALNRTYLAYQTEQGPRLILVRPEAGVGEKIVTQPAAEVLSELVQLAKDHDGGIR